MKACEPSLLISILEMVNMEKKKKKQNMEDCTDKIAANYIQGSRPVSQDDKISQDINSERVLLFLF